MTMWPASSGISPGTTPAGALTFACGGAGGRATAKMAVMVLEVVWLILVGSTAAAVGTSGSDSPVVRAEAAAPAAPIGKPHPRPGAGQPQSGGRLEMPAGQTPPPAAGSTSASQGSDPPGAATAGAALPPLPPGEEIYDLRPLQPVPFPWLATIARWAVALALAWLGWRSLRWWLAPVARAPRPPRPVDHLQEALRALDRLRASPVWDPSRVKDVCERVALILKVFLKGRFGLGLGGAATSDELLDDLRRQRVPVSLVTRSAELLGVCDEVRYARGSLGDRPLDHLYTQVRELLLRGDWRP